MDNTLTPPTANDNCCNIRHGRDCIDRDMPLNQWCGFCASYVNASAAAALYSATVAA